MWCTESINIVYFLLDLVSACLLSSAKVRGWKMTLMTWASACVLTSRLITLLAFWIKQTSNPNSLFKMMNSGISITQHHLGQAYWLTLAWSARLPEYFSSLANWVIYFCGMMRVKRNQVSKYCQDSLTFTKINVAGSFQGYFYCELQVTMLQTVCFVAVTPPHLCPSVFLAVCFYHRLF